MKLCLSLLALFAAALVSSRTVAAEGDPFKITTRKPDDVVAVQVEKERTLFDVKSPSGISGAALERLGDKWPERVVLRLRLKGLESFQVRNGKTTLHAAVSSGNLKVRRWQDDKEDTPLDEKSPFWLDVRILGADGKAATLPLKDGYFEIALPKALFEGNPGSITVGWIDFYR